MLNLLGRPTRLCDGISRRGFLKLGALGLGGLALPDLLTAQADQGPARRDTAVILFWMAGGPSHIDTYDMKPDAPREVAGPFRPVRTNLPGYQLCELMPKQARLMDRISIIRSIRHQHGVHDDASHWVQTGYPLLNARERGQHYPAQGSVISQLRGANQPGVPSYVCIPEAYSSPRGFYQRSAFLGAQHDPVNGGGDPSLGNYRLPEFTLPADLTLARLQERRGLLRHVDGLRRQVDAHGLLGQMDESHRRAFELITGQRAREAFDLSREPISVREGYGRHFWGQAALLARRLVEAGVTFVTINLYEADVDWWDDHYHIEENLRWRLPRFDHTLAALLEDLESRGLAERVLVAAFGEFGRTPMIDSYAGRSHWPRAMSALLAGGGIRGGRIIGSTTANGADPKDHPLGPGDLLATMYRALGIDHEHFMRDRQNRPLRLVEHGQPINELF